MRCLHCLQTLLLNRIYFIGSNKRIDLRSSAVSNTARDVAADEADLVVTGILLVMCWCQR